MHWGLKIGRNQCCEKVIDTQFTVTSAVLDFEERNNGITKVYVEVDKQKFLLCVFYPQHGVFQMQLNNCFSVGERVSFSHDGPGVVFLSGNIHQEVKSSSIDSVYPVKSSRVVESQISSPKKSNAKPKLEKKEGKNSFKKSPGSLTDLLKGEELPDEDSEDEDEDFNGVFEEDEADEDEEDEEESLDEEQDDEESDEVEESVKADTKQGNISQRTESKDGVEEEEEEESEDESGDESDDEMSDESIEEVPVVEDSKQKKKLPNGVAEGEKAKSNKESNATNAPKTIKEAPKIAGKIIGPKEVKSGGVTCQDIIPGKGQVAFSGKHVSVYYEGRLKSNKKMFDKVDSGAPFKFKLGAGEVITAWDIGIAGMRIGGKRRIVCPPKMGYGKKGAPPQIPPNAILVFDVTLKGVK